MTRGRKPKPTALKLVTGNPGKRPLNVDEPRPDSIIPDCPEHLDAEARAEWSRVSEQLHRIGVLTEVDRAALAAYCQAWSRWVEAEANIKRFGVVLWNKEKTWPSVSPYLVIANQSLKQMQAFLTEFGMTPASRSRIRAEPPSKPRSALEAFVASKHG